MNETFGWALLVCQVPAVYFFLGALYSYYFEHAEARMFGFLGGIYFGLVSVVVGLIAALVVTALAGMGREAKDSAKASLRAEIIAEMEAKRGQG